jgi:hypothetical protein
MKKKFIAVACMTLGLGINTVQAATISQLVNSYGFFQWEDDNGEMIVNNNGGNPTQLDVGDYLTGVVEISRILQLQAPFNSAILIGNAGNSHLAATFTTEVVSKTPNGTGWDFTFAAVGGGAGTIFNFYEDAIDDLNLLACANDAACKAAVTDGTLVLEMGFSGDPDEFWVANNVTTDDIALLKAAGPASKFGFANFGLGLTGINLLGNFTESQSTVGVEPGAPDGNDKVVWLNSTDILGGSASTAYQATSDADFVSQVQVPEPTTLALIGLGLLGMSSTLRRKTAQN